MKKLLVLTFFILVVSLTYGVVENNVRALKLALDDEYKAQATYMKAIEDSGEKPPFTIILEAEENHIEALIPIFDKYGIEIPSNPYIGHIEGFESLKEACAAGMEAERRNVDLYEQLFTLADDLDILSIFSKLQSASRNNHLSAFERCAM